MQPKEVKVHSKYSQNAVIMQSKYSQKAVTSWSAYRLKNVHFCFSNFRTYLKPLLKMLKKQTLTDDVRDSLVKMIIFALNRDYILSHEAYMEMAIGKNF